MLADGLQDRWRQSCAFSEVGNESMGACIACDRALPVPTVYPCVALLDRLTVGWA